MANKKIEYNEIVEPETDTESDSDAESFASNLEDMEEDELTEERGVCKVSIW